MKNILYTNEEELMKKIIFFLVIIMNIFSCTYATTEFKGVWVATVYNLDYPTKQTQDVEYLKSEATLILDNVKEMGLNAVFLQVRPSADAFYKSDIFPWSKYLTGKNGLAPNNNFDPLEFWVKEAHRRGIELHAWINPYRITKNGDEEYNLITNNSPAKLYSEYIVKYSDGNYYFNPGIPEVRKLLIDGALEIVEKYDVDGIHMDDYFYPGKNFGDLDTYKKYGGTFANIEDWRRNNVDLLVKELDEKIHEKKQDIAFGISPFGIWANNTSNLLGSNTSGTESYYSHYADTRKWALNGWVDYIAPQIYWERGHKSADYITLVNWWADTLSNSNTKLYIGLADYRCIDAKTSSAWHNAKEIEQQMQINEESKIISGEIHYRYSSLIESNSLKKLLEEKYENSQISVYIDNKKVAFEYEPLIENNRTLVPLRTIFEKLGAVVGWANNTVTAKKGNTVITLEIGSSEMKVDNKIVKLDAVAQIKNNRTFVSLRAISEAFNNVVEWNGITKTIKIKS